MNLDVHEQYSQYSESIILHLIHNSEKYKDLWIEKFPETKDQANNYFNDVNCGCSPVLLHQYKAARFHADLMTVDFINSNSDAFNMEDFMKTNPAKHVQGHVFSIPAQESSYKEFISSLQANRFIFNHYITTQIDDRILITFF